MKLLALLLLAAPLTAHAQTPAGTLPICSEVCTITASSTAAVFEFGVGTKLNTITNAVYPLAVNCGNAADCALLGGDPDSGVVKTIYAVEQAQSYTVTWTLSGVTTVVTVPAIAKTPTSSYVISGPVTLTFFSDGSFTISGVLGAVKQ